MGSHGHRWREPGTNFGSVVLGLSRPLGRGADGVRDLLTRLRCIQLDPLDRVGTNADLVVLARLDGVARGDVYRHLLPGHAFEHFAKERCLLPASALPAYRVAQARAGWWRESERMQRLDEGLLADVLAEVRERGPLTPGELTQRGEVAPLDWNGWKGTKSASTLALEVLWTRCEVVVCGRERNTKRYDLPERALPQAAALPPPDDWRVWAVEQRIHAAGMLGTHAGIWWSSLTDLRASEVPEQLVAQGRAVRVKIAGTKRTWLAPPGLLEGPVEEPDDRLRILGPLDPLLWERELALILFGFEYVWEVYKPADKRRWGWYVVPLLHRGQLVGRLEAHTEAGRAVVDRLWKESPHFDDDALEAALARHGLTGET
jgi:uncharacterized protein YcaQ